jgi:EAL domain-containing protein (putative c-di-GMP-specific phosphodiesterase class I)/GGDEF domain-containing protein
MDAPQDADARAEELDRIIAARQISIVLQPIFDPSRGRIVAYEALTRGPEGSPLHMPLALFGAAAEAGRLPALDALCLREAMEHYVALDLPGQLFLNITPVALARFVAFGPSLETLAGEADLDPARIVIEVTEDGVGSDVSQLRRAVSTLRQSGFGFAIDDLGAGFAGLRLWSELKPDFVKIDRYFVSRLHMDATRIEFVRSMLDIARAMNCRVIAEGVETADECRELAELGVDLLQGFFLARPESHPASVPPPHVQEFLCQTMPSLEAAGLPTVEGLVVAVEPVSPATTIDRVLARFAEQESLRTLPIVSGRRPVGSVRKGELLELMSRPFSHEIYARKPVSRIMNCDPVAIDASAPLQQASRMVTHAARLRLDEDFLITRDGEYVGLGHVIDLLRQITEVQLSTARHANPLTMLPGNVPIYDCINRLLRRKVSFHVCYIDVDNFKPFNDHYGYARGDDVLLHVSRLLEDNASPRTDFVGHLGGDDFVIVFRSGDWRMRLGRMLRGFQDSVGDFYSDEDLRRRGIHGRDRFGTERTFPLLSLSAAVLDTDEGEFRHAEEIAQAIVEVKQQAKLQPGCSIASYAPSA